MGRSLRQRIRVGRKQHELAKGKGERGGGEGKRKMAPGMKHTHTFVHTPAWISHLNNCCSSFQRCHGDPGNFYLAEKHSLSQGPTVTQCHNRRQGTY